MNFFRKIANLPHSSAPEPVTEREERLEIAGQEIAILIRCHPRAKRIKLSVDASRGLPVLTLPQGIPEAEGLRFAVKNANWLLKVLANIPQRVAFAPGVLIPFKGKDHEIRHDPSRRGTVQVDEAGILSISGGIEHLPRRLTDFLKREARTAIKPLALDAAQTIDQTPDQKPTRKLGRITVRDQRTRWGSCSAKGDLSFSWRLILAPPEILNYVVCHEVAHLVHMDHSPAFWRTVETVYPEYRAAREWLGTEGTRLHRIG